MAPKDLSFASSRRVRTIHRWAALVFAVAVIPTFFLGQPEDRSGVAANVWLVVLSLGFLTMLITGITLQVKHYRARRRLRGRTATAEVD